MARVGIVGLGRMGSSFANNLLSKGNEVHVYNRTKEKARSLVERGAVLHDTPRELAALVDAVLTSLTDERAVESLALGNGEGFLDGMQRGTVWIDLSTIDPDASVKLATECEKLGLQRLDAPVIGSPAMASEGRVVMPVGGRLETFERNENLLRQIGNPVIRVGPDGAGHRMKLVVNLYLALVVEAFSETHVLSRKLGFDPGVFVDVLNRTPHRNYFTEGKGPKIVEGDYAPTFTLDNLLKDVRLAVKQAGESKAQLPAAETALQQLALAVKDGLGEEDYSAVAKYAEMLNGLRAAR